MCDTPGFILAGRSLLKKECVHETGRRSFRVAVALVRIVVVIFVNFIIVIFVMAKVAAGVAIRLARGEGRARSGTDHESDTTSVPEERLPSSNKHRPAHNRITCRSEE